MKLKKLTIIALLILAVVASTAYIGHEQSNNVEITLKTNGTNVEVQTSSFLFFTNIPVTMKQEMQQKALNDIYEDNSTVDSIKNDMKEIAGRYNYNVTVTIDSQYGTDQLPMPATVRGTSMLPTLQDGEELILLKTNDFKVGDIVVAHHPTYGLIVKRVAKIEGDQVYLMSDNREVVITDNTISKGLDTWLPKSSVVGVVKEY